MPLNITRRRWTQLAAAAAIAGCAPPQEASPLIDQPAGNFQFLKGSGPYSSGAVAAPGYEVVHAIFQPLPALADAFALIEQHLAAIGRPIAALCGMELRIPEALSPEGFAEFNQPYIERLKQWETHVDGLNPIARTNVAYAVDPVAAPSVYGFSYTVPSSAAAKTFVVAGGGELSGNVVESDGIVRRGDVSEQGMQAKVDRVLTIMGERLSGMGLDWSDVTQSNIYSVQNFHPLMAAAIIPSLGAAARQGVRWQFARPPVLEIEFEMDLRGVRQEIIVSGG